MSKASTFPLPSFLGRATMLGLVTFLALVTPLRAGLAATSVAWQPWSAETFARARAEGKLVILDAAAEWCHWCHVMERTTYADPEVTALLASRFVAVRVDVDASPELAERYGDWGWPATIVFSSSMDEIKKMRGYIAPRRFVEILKDALAQSDRTKGKGPFRQEEAPPTAQPGALTPARAAALRDTHETELQTYFDAKGGGWGYRQKSSTWMNVEHALMRHAATGKEFWQWRALMSLDRLTRIMDPVWGGVYQYSTDGDWEHPHFEKLMTYQAGTLESYVQASLATGQEKYLDVARKLYGYMSTHLCGEDGAFFTTQDADLLAPAGGGAPVDGHQYYALGDAERRRLGMPRVDRNVYARENGLAIAAVCQLYAATGKLEHLQAAERAAGRVLASHALRGGVAHATKPGAQALLHLADNAAFGRGLIALHEATGQARWFDAARALADAMQRELWDEAQGAFFAHSPDPAAVGVLKQRRLPVDDNVAAGRFFLRLALLEDSAPRRVFARRILEWLSAGERPKEMGRFVGSYLCFLEESNTEPLHVTVLGRASDPASAAIAAAVYRFAHPHCIVERRDPSDAGLRKLEIDFPALDKPAAFVCTAGSCSLPITDPARVLDQLRRAVERRR